MKVETLASLESLQFMCCECAKILRYLVSRNPTYERNGHLVVGNAPGDIESEGPAIDWESGTDDDIVGENEPDDQPRGGPGQKNEAVLQRRLRSKAL